MKVLQPTQLLCEELADIGERFEFEGVACGVKKEHGGLFADLALETDRGLDDEGDTCAAETLGQ
jgi:hypothetical protein